MVDGRRERWDSNDSALTVTGRSVRGTALLGHPRERRVHVDPDSDEALLAHHDPGWGRLARTTCLRMLTAMCSRVTSGMTRWVHTVELSALTLSGR